MNYSTFLSEIEKSRFRKFYLITGKEEFLAEKAVQTLIDRLIPAEERALNLSVFYGKEAEKLPEALATPAMFGSSRLSIVRQAQHLTGKPLEAVERFIRQPPDDGYLVLWAGDIDKRSRFFKRLDKLIDPVDCTRLRDSQTVKWMSDYAASLGKSLDKEAIARLSAINWPGLRELASEIDQLALMVGDKAVIRAADVDEMGGASFALDRWALSEAVRSLDSAAAFQAIDRLSLSSLKPTQVIGDLFRLLRQLLVLRWYVDRRQTSEARKNAGLPNFLFDRYLQDSRKMKRENIELALERLAQADLAIKRGERSDDMELSVLTASIIKILAGT